MFFIFILKIIKEKKEKKKTTTTKIVFSRSDQCAIEFFASRPKKRGRGVFFFFSVFTIPSMWDERMKKKRGWRIYKNSRFFFLRVTPTLLQLLVSSNKVLSSLTQGNIQQKKIKIIKTPNPVGN